MDVTVTPESIAPSPVGPVQSSERSKARRADGKVVPTPTYT